MKKFSLLTSLLLVLAIVLGLAGATATSASAAIAKWPSFSEWAYAESYCRAAGDTPVYTSAALTTRGTASPYQERSAVIYATDVIHIYAMTNSYAYVSYPVGNGRRCGYIKTSALTPNNMEDFRATAKGRAVVYDRPDGRAWDAFVAGDYVIGFATSGKYTQCFYTSRAGNRTMRMGWVLTTDFDKHVRNGVTPNNLVITTTTTTTTAKIVIPSSPGTKSSNPVGYLDAVTAGNGTVTVTGWAFDWDKVAAPLDIHVYIGGPIGSDTGEGHGNGIANLHRPDVNAVYAGAGSYHGFSHTVTTAKRGSQTVYVYAINASGTPGVNVLIGKGTVNISNTIASYTVKYDANGGTGAPAAQTKEQGKGLKLSTAKPTNGSLVFKHWNTKKDGTGNWYLPGETYTVDANVTLYAQWTRTLYGDLNGDGKVDAADLKVLQQYLDYIKKINLFNADLNGDGKITAADLTLLQQYINRTIARFPVEK